MHARYRRQMDGRQQLVSSRSLKINSNEILHSDKRPQNATCGWFKHTHTTNWRRQMDAICLKNVKSPYLGNSLTDHHKIGTVTRIYPTYTWVLTLLTLSTVKLLECSKLKTTFLHYLTLHYITVDGCHSKKPLNHHIWAMAQPTDMKFGWVMYRVTILTLQSADFKNFEVLKVQNGGWLPFWTQLPPQKNGYSPHPIFGPRLLWPVLWSGWLGGRKGIWPVKNVVGWWRWALVCPDGVAHSRMVGVSASVNLPLHHKVQKFSSGAGSPGWFWKSGSKTVVVVVVVYCGWIKMPLCRR